MDHKNFKKSQNNSKIRIVEISETKKSRLTHNLNTFKNEIKRFDISKILISQKYVLETKILKNIRLLFQNFTKFKSMENN